MTKAELIAELTKETGSKKTAEAAFNCVVEQIKKGLKKEGTVSLYGMGTFRVVKRAARKGRNPKTGETIKIKAKKVVRFAPAKALKDAVAK